jgi:hypothetical protein
MQGVVKFMADRGVHDLEIEFTEWKTKQDHLVRHVDELHDDMKEVKKAVFQAKWMLIGAVVVIGLTNSGSLLELIKLMK